MTGHWPWPKDTRTDKLKRIVDSYRTALLESDPAAAKIVDARMCEYGESWVCGDEPINVENEATVDELYQQFGPGFEPWNIHMWAQRAPDQLPKRGKKNGKILYRVGDVLAYQLSLR